MTNAENWNDKKFVLEKVKQNGLDLYYASEELKDDREVVLEAIKENGLALEYASERLKKDKELALIAIRSKQNHSWYSLAYISEELRNNKEVVVEALEKQLKYPLNYSCEIMGYIGNELGKELLELAIEHLKK